MSTATRSALLSTLWLLTRLPPTRRLFWARSSVCCADVRAMLGCSSDFTEPCREFTGACAGAALSVLLQRPVKRSGGSFGFSHKGLISTRGLLSNDPAFPLSVPDLLEQFGSADLQDVSVSADCTAFPDPDSPRDNIVCSLLLVALMLPMRLIVVRMFEIANEAQIPEQWTFWFGPRCWIFGRTSWWFQEPGNPTPAWRRALAPMGRQVDTFFIKAR